MDMYMYMYVHVQCTRVYIVLERCHLLTDKYSYMALLNCIGLVTVQAMVYEARHLILLKEWKLHKMCRYDKYKSIITYLQSSSTKLNGL